MLKHKFPIVIALLMAFTFTLAAPAAPAYANPLSDLLPKTDSANSSSEGNGLLNILMGLLLGKLFNSATDTSTAPAVPGKALSSGSPSSATGQAIVASAQKYMGVPYVWGGSTPKGFDCSGFTQYVMKENGIQIPRTAAEQYAAGTPVDKSALKVGDLVFFTTYKAGASHVGFYMGNGKFIHASSGAEKVTISSLDEKYYVEHYIGSRSYF